MNFYLLLTCTGSSNSNIVIRNLPTISYPNTLHLITGYCMLSQSGEYPVSNISTFFLPSFSHYAITFILFSCVLSSFSSYSISLLFSSSPSPPPSHTPASRAGVGSEVTAYVYMSGVAGPLPPVSSISQVWRRASDGWPRRRHPLHRRHQKPPPAGTPPKGPFALLCPPCTALSSIFRPDLSLSPVLPSS